MDEGLLLELKRFNECTFKPTLSSGKFTNVKPTLLSGKIKPFSKNKHEIELFQFGQNSLYLVCVHHIVNACLITGTRAYNVDKNHIMISRGRSLIGRAGVLNS